MKRYTVPAGRMDLQQHAHPERTAYKSARSVGDTSLNFDLTFQVWPSREAMARSIRMQQKREPRYDDWRAVVKLTDAEGF